jgi:hypothetical protein
MCVQSPAGLRLSDNLSGLIDGNDARITALHVTDASIRKLGATIPLRTRRRSGAEAINLALAGLFFVLLALVLVNFGDPIHVV